MRLDLTSLNGSKNRILKSSISLVSQLSESKQIGTKMEYDGKDLIDLGYEPGKHFAEMLKVANNMAEHEIPHARILEALDEMYEDANFVPETIPLREVDAFGGYNAYLDPGETEYEEKNNKAVYETMDQLIRTPTLVDGAVLPDACPAGPLGTIPVGGLAVAENAIHPGMH